MTKSHGRPIGDRSGTGAAITALRQRRGMTQAELADALNISQQTVSYYEAGNVDIPLSRLQELAAALGVKVGVFFTSGPR